MLKLMIKTKQNTPCVVVRRGYLFKIAYKKQKLSFFILNRVKSFTIDTRDRGY